MRNFLLPLAALSVMLSACATQATQTPRNCPDAGCRPINLEKVSALPQPGSWPVEHEGEALHLLPGLRLQGADIVGVQRMIDPQSGRVFVEVTLSDFAGTRMQAFSTAEIGNRLAFVVDGQVLATPVVSASFGAEFQISAASVAEADQITRLVRGHASDK
ncbi:MAG: hypothetical protein Q4G62_12220 [Pseudomonadota bacterium]|nr:hypothetical protein [Pseudomonadota bacterium]